jgi:hypothetical protein
LRSSRLIQAEFQVGREIPHTKTAGLAPDWASLPAVEPATGTPPSMLVPEDFTVGKIPLRLPLSSL